MTPPDRSLDDVVLGAWAPAGWGRIVVLLGQGLVIHKFVLSLKAAAADAARSIAIGAGGPLGDRDTVVADAVGAAAQQGSPFVDKVLRNGVEGLLASKRRTLIAWDDVVSAEFHPQALNRGRLVVHTGRRTYKLRFLQNTVVVGELGVALRYCLGDRFTDHSAN